MVYCKYSARPIFRQENITTEDTYHRNIKIYKWNVERHIFSQPINFYITTIPSPEQIAEFSGESSITTNCLRKLKLCTPEAQRSKYMISKYFANPSIILQIHVRNIGELIIYFGC